MPSKKYIVKIIPNSRATKVVEQKDDFLKIKLAAPAIEGKANKALILFLSDFLKIPKSRLEIIKGQKSREKIIQIN